MGNWIRFCAWRDWLYRIHVVTGLIAALWLLLVAVTGVLINHQEALGLLDVEIRDKYLPDYYRADVRRGTTRLNIIVTDLHSGRIFGAQGHWVGDGIAILLLVSLLTGSLSYWAKKRVQNWRHFRNHAQGASSPPQSREQFAARRTAQEAPEENSSNQSHCDRAVVYSSHSCERE